MQLAYHEKELQHYLELVGYWQDECRRSQEECARLRSINIKLERSNQLLSHQTSSIPDGRPSTATNTVKRKPPSSPSKAPKRSKATLTDKSAAQTQEVIENDFDFLEELGEGALRHSRAVLYACG